MKSFKYIALSLALVGGMTSCSDSFLDHEPDERTHIDNAEKVRQLIAGSYPEVSFDWLGELSSDNLIDNQAPHLPSSPNDKQILSHYNYASYAKYDEELYRFEQAKSATYSSSDSPGQVWNGYYNSIAGVNYALQAADSIEHTSGATSSLNASRAEGLLVRAWDHFCLVNLFSQAYKDPETSKKELGIPYITKPTDVVSPKVERPSVAETYADIQKDLEAALPIVSDENLTTAPKYHFNVNAAHAFAARFYLYTRQWEKVIQQADLVLGTDSASLANMMLKYSVFAGCSSSSDYAIAWQDPSLNNNLMLTTTYSWMDRRCFGYRYSLAGPNAQKVLMFHSNSVLYPHWIANPLALVSGMLFSNSSHDYGFFSCKVGERFQYMDKLAGTGYVHTIQRTFTANELLLERAEAKVMLGRYDEAFRDMQLYWSISIHSMEANDYKSYADNGYCIELTKANLVKYWGDPANANCFANWDFTKNISSSYVVPAEAVPYMNFINDFRRFETSFEGLRFFDLKRWGVEYSHFVGVNSQEIKLTSNDPRRAIEIPWEVESAGMASSRPLTTPAGAPADLQNVKPETLVRK